MISENQYRMPAEWHQHAATQLHWPLNRETWPGNRLARVERVYLDIIEALYPFEPIHLFIPDQRYREKLIDLFATRSIDLHQITFHLRPTNDVWARDCGPVFVKNNDGEWAIVDWIYNAWGGKYPPYEDDNKLPQYVAEKYDLLRMEPGMVLEGGSVEVNGKGVLLTTESVLLNENRNPQHSKEEIEQKLASYLGVDKIIWLEKGLKGDDTDGHIDDLARFLDGNTILAMVAEEGDINHEALNANFKILREATNQDGRPFHIETLPLPQTRIEGTTADGSEYVPASYANFYIANGIVLVPTYDPRYDDMALELIGSYFPDRKTVGIPCADLVWGQGSIHCITQPLYGI